jgi:lipoate-protein ligase A
MAIDEALLDNALHTGTSFLRLYCWDPPTLSVGRNQRFAADAAFPVVRRPTGGKAVWHEHEVTYAVAAPIVAFGSLRDAYCQIHTRIAAALRSLGVEASLAPYRPPVRPSVGPPSCFAAPVGGELLAGGRKVAGSAQVRRRDAFLQHGSILLDGSQDVVAAVSAATTLAAILGRPVSFDEVTAAIIAAWGEPLRPSGHPAGRPAALASLAGP